MKMSAREPELVGSAPLAAVASLPTTAIETGTWKYLEPHYEDKLPPCSQACPAEMMLTFALLATGNMVAAARLLRSGTRWRQLLAGSAPILVSVNVTAIQWAVQLPSVC